MRDSFVCTSVASAAVMLVPAAAAFEQSISYSKVILYIEIGGRAQSNAHFQGYCQGFCALWPSRDELDA
jgi:hypothetical protein